MLRCGGEQSYLNPQFTKSEIKQYARTEKQEVAARVYLTPPRGHEIPQHRHPSAVSWGGGRVGLGTWGWGLGAVFTSLVHPAVSLNYAHV